MSGRSTSSPQTVADELKRLHAALECRWWIVGAWRRRRWLRQLMDAPETPRTVALLVVLAEGPHPHLARAAEERLSRMQDPAAIDSLCEQAIEHPDGKAAELCHRTRRRPSDPERACLFLFVTRRLDEYFEEDYQFQNLRLEYDRAPATVQAQVMAVVRSGDARCVGFFSSRKRLSDCSEKEIILALRSYRRHRDWQRIFDAFIELPLKYGFIILEELRHSGWQPASVDGAALLRSALRESAEHIAPPAASNTVAGTFFESLLERGRAEARLPELVDHPESRLLEDLANAPPEEAVVLTAAIAARPSPSFHAMLAIESHRHWMVRLAGRVLGLAADLQRDGHDDPNYWVRRLAPPAPLVEFWPAKGSPAHLESLSSTPEAVRRGPFRVVRRVLELLLAYRITTGEFEPLAVEPDVLTGTFETAVETIEDFAASWRTEGER